MLQFLESKKADFIYEGLMKPALVPTVQIQQQFSASSSLKVKSQKQSVAATGKKQKGNISDDSLQNIKADQPEDLL